MSQHTMGEWTVDPEGEAAYCIEARGQVIAEVHVNGEGEANANLMAAAPELLEELTIAVKRIERALMQPRLL